MAKITGQTGLSLATDNTLADGNIFIDTTGFLIYVGEYLALDEGGVSLQALYSFLMTQWATGDYEMYKFPIESITPGEFELKNGWDFANDTARYLIRDGGWNLLSADNSTIWEVWMNIQTLGNFEAATDQAYFMHSAVGTPVNFQLDGVVNQAVMIYASGDTAVGAFDYRLTSNSEFSVFLREQGKTYGSYNLNIEQAKTSLKNNVYALPLSNAVDLDIEASDASIVLDATPGTFTVATNVITVDDASFAGLIVGDTMVLGSTDGGTNDGTVTIKVWTSDSVVEVNETLTDETGTVSVTIQGKASYLGMTITWFGDLLAAASDFTYANGAADTSTLTSAASHDFAALGYLPGHQFRLSGSLAGANDGHYTILTAVGGVLTLVGDNVFATPGLDTGTPTINQSREIGTGNFYDYRIVIDGNSGTLQEIYEYDQYQLRLATDIDAGPGTELGQVSDAQLGFVGPTLKTKLTSDGGVYIDNFAVADTNDLVFIDDLGTERTYPYVAAGTINFNDNLQADGASAKYWMYFSSAGTFIYNTSTAAIVDDNDAADIAGDLTGNLSSVTFSYDYEGNVQGGRTPNTDAAIVLIAIGTNNAQYVSALDSLTRSTLMSFTLTAAKERNYVA